MFLPKTRDHRSLQRNLITSRVSLKRGRSRENLLCAERNSRLFSYCFVCGRGERMSDLFFVEDIYTYLSTRP